MTHVAIVVIYLGFILWLAWQYRQETKWRRELFKPLTPVA